MLHFKIFKPGGAVVGESEGDRDGLELGLLGGDTVSALNKSQKFVLTSSVFVTEDVNGRPYDDRLS